MLWQGKISKGDSLSQSSCRSNSLYSLLSVSGINLLRRFFFESSPHKKIKELCSVSCKITVSSRVRLTGRQQTSPMVCKHCGHVLRHTTFVALRRSLISQDVDDFVRGHSWYNLLVRKNTEHYAKIALMRTLSWPSPYLNYWDFIQEAAASIAFFKIRPS